MPPSLPKISVVTVSYNQGRFIRSAIESVVAQQYPSFEHIVVDGGSTDETLEILKQYPHLKWSSEKDNGQVDALNKGFSLAQGEIIAWLNSDDWYELGTFSKVAEALTTHEIALAAAVQTDEHGASKEYIANTPRSLYDILRYWVPNAWLAQPSVFFTKRALESVRYAEGYLDEGLYFCMDYDLWLRLAERYEFGVIPGVASYFRIYAENKTGKHPLAAQRECSRVYRKFSNILSRRERSVSYVIAVREISDAFGRTFTSIKDQDLSDAEVFIADYGGDKEVGKKLQEAALELGDSTPQVTVRYIEGCSSDYLATFNRAIEASAGLVTTLLHSGDTIPKEFTRETLNLFNADVMGLVFPFVTSELQRVLYDEEIDALSFTGLFSSPYFFPRLVARTIALREVGGFPYTTSPPLSVKTLILKILFRAWKVVVKNPLSVRPVPLMLERERELLSHFFTYYNYFSLQTVLEENDRDPFSRVRACITPEVPPELGEEVARALALLPPGWHEPEAYKDAEFLLSLLDTRPDFSPAWWYLAKICKAEGRDEEEKMALERYHSLRGKS